MIAQTRGFSIILSLILLSSVVLPAYAEVTSLNTDSAFYRGGSKIHFSGTTLNTDPPYVTIIVENPNNDFVLLTSGISNSSHAFDIIVDTSTPENQQKFLQKGVYNATAFISNKTAGKTISFIFSQDGSAVIPSPPAGLVITSRTYNEIDLSWSAPPINGGATIGGYKIERNDGSNFNVIQNTQSTTYQDKGLVSNKQYSYRVSATNSAGTSSPSSVVSGITLAAPQSSGSSSQINQSNPNTTPQQKNPSQSIDEIIKQRIENAKKLHNLQQSQAKKISFIEKMGVVDAIGNHSLSNSPPFANNAISFDSSNTMYILIILAGVGVITAVLYGKKNKLWFSSSSQDKDVLVHSSDSSIIPDEQIEEDYSFMILKNRLAKGEISIDEFNRLKDALKEP